MEHRNLGATGLKTSVAGLGCNNFGRRCDARITAAIVERALGLGVTFFDTADVYGPRGLSEEYLGQALEGHRHQVVLASKVGSPMGDDPLSTGASRRHIVDACRDSLRRLRTDYIDLYQIHFPDPHTPIEETMRALDDLVRAGHVRYIGCSNFPAWQVVEAQWTARAFHGAKLVSTQDQYSLLDRRVERELTPVCEKYGLSLIPYYPLASGLLTGKYRQGEPLPAGTRLALSGPNASRFLTDRNWQVVEAVRRFAESAGRPMVEIALAWLATRPAVDVVIAGATSPEQVEQNVRALEWKMTADEAQEVERITARRD